MKVEYIIVYAVLVLLLSFVMEIIDRCIKAISKKVKAKKLAEAQQPIKNDEEV